MKAEILREDLLAVLKEAGHAVNERAVLPVLKCVYLGLEDGRCRVMATDLEIGYKREMILAHVEEPGAVVAGHQILADWLEAVPGDKVSLALEEHTVKATDAVTGEEYDVVTPESLKLKCGRTEATMKEVFSVDEWPVFPQDASVAATIDAEDLVDMIEGVAWAASHDYPGPEGGVALEIGGDVVRAVATDKQVLSLWEKPVSVCTDGKVVVPAESIVKIRPLLSGAVQICLGENAASFLCGDITVTVQTMDVKYFDYERHVESARANELAWWVETAVLRKLVMAGSSFARADAHPYLSLKWQPGDPSSVEMEIRHERGDLQGAVDGMDGDVGKLETHLGIGYLVKAIGTMCSDVVEVRLAGGASAVYLGDVGEDHEVVVMPVQLTRVG